MKHKSSYPTIIREASELGIKGLDLLGRAHFRKTHHILGPHCHRGMEFIVLLKGTQQYEVEGHIYTLHGGDVFMTLPEEEHSGGKAVQDVAEIIWFQLSYGEKSGFLGMEPSVSDYLYNELHQYKQRVLHVSQTQLQVLERSFDLLCGSSDKERALGHNYLLAFLIRNLCGLEEPLGRNGDSGFDAAAAKAYMKEHLYENPQLEELAACCGFSPSKYSACFKEAVGMTPHAYMIQLKMERAKELLRESDKNITEIAQELMFSTSDYFASVFKKYTGKTPTQYRSED